MGLKDLVVGGDRERVREGAERHTAREREREREIFSPISFSFFLPDDLS